MYTKQTKNHRPQLIFFRKMKKKMIHWFSTSFTIKYHSNTAICLFQKLSIVKILPKAAIQEKNATLGGTLDCHTIFQGKSMTEALNLKTSPHCWLPTKFVITNTPRIHGIKHNPKTIKWFWFPILWWMMEPNVPMKPPIEETHHLWNKKLPCLANTIQF